MYMYLLGRCKALAACCGTFGQAKTLPHTRCLSVWGCVFLGRSWATWAVRRPSVFCPSLVSANGWPEACRVCFVLGASWAVLWWLAKFLPWVPSNSAPSGRRSGSSSGTSIGQRSGRACAQRQAEAALRAEFPKVFSMVSDAGGAALLPRALRSYWKLKGLPEPEVGDVEDRLERLLLYLRGCPLVCVPRV